MRYRNFRRIVTVMTMLLVLSTVACTAGVELTVWLTDFNPDVQEMMTTTIVPAFESTYPGTKVDMQYVSWGDFDSKLITAFAAGVAPDIFQPGAEWRGQIAEQGLARPIDDFVERWQATRDYFPGAWGAVVWKGRTYGIPYLTAPRTFWYRADLFAEMGLDYDTPPVTWDEMMDIMPKLTTVDSEGSVVRAAAAIPASDFQFWLPLLWQAGGAFVSEDSNEPLFESPAGVEASTYYLDLYERSRSFGAMPSGDIISGGYAMQYGNASFVRNALNSNPEVAASIWAAPPMKHRKQVTATYTDWLAISTQTKYADEAFEFIKWLMQTEYLVAYNETFYYVPPNRATTGTAYVRQNQAIAQLVNRVMPYTIAYPSFNAANRFVFQDLWNKAVNRESTPQQVISDFARSFVPLTTARGN